MKLTENMRLFLKQDAQEHYNKARNHHIWAMGCHTNEEAIQLEQLADEHRALAHMLENLANGIEV